MEWDMNGQAQVDAVVIGAGVIGLAVARALSLDNREVIVLEAARMIGAGISSRNSEVIHAGLYYPPDSLKARLCVAGKARLYDYCRERAIERARLGKLLVACAQPQDSALRQLQQNAARNGVTDLQMLTRADLRSLEPELDCHAALLSPSTGIVDVHGLMLSYLGDLENSGGMIVFGARVLAGKVTARGVSLLIDQDGGYGLSCKTVVNCTGLSAQQVASLIQGFPAMAVPRQYLAKGDYFKLASHSPFRHLVYPLPSDGGMGIHLTLDLAGRARFGPDVQWMPDGQSVDDIDYRVSEDRLPLFEAAIRQYWPGLPAGALTPDYSGIRPKLHGAGAAAADFMIQDGREHGAPGLINLYGIESPGITASLAIAEHVRRIAGSQDSRKPPSSRPLATAEGGQSPPPKRDL